MKFVNFSLKFPNIFKDERSTTSTGNRAESNMDWPEDTEAIEPNNHDNGLQNKLIYMYL